MYAEILGLATLALMVLLSIFGPVNLSYYSFMSPGWFNSVLFKSVARKMCLYPNMPNLIHITSS